MPSLIYNSCLEDLANGDINFGADTFYVMLVEAGYVPNKDSHTRRSSVTNEASGTGYTADGAASAATVLKDTGTDRVTISFAQVVWTGATITAAGAVIYKRRGGAASADELVAYVDFGGDVSSTAAPFTVTFSTPLTIQN